MSIHIHDSTVMLCMHMLYGRGYVSKVLGSIGFKGYRLRTCMEQGGCGLGFMLGLGFRVWAYFGLGVWAYFGLGVQG